MAGGCQSWAGSSSVGGNGLAACTVALTIPLTTAAHAETQTKKDPRGDVTSLVPLKAAPKPGVDITCSTNTYKGSTLTMTMTAANLVKDDFGAYWLINAGDANYVLIQQRLGGQTQTQFFPTNPGQARLGTIPQGVPACEGFSVKALPKRDKMVGTVPRSCLEGANTVRIGAALVQLTDQGQKVDDARRDGFPTGVTEPKLGPALDRN